MAEPVQIVFVNHTHQIPVLVSFNGSLYPIKEAREYGDHESPRGCIVVEVGEKWDIPMRERAKWRPRDFGLLSPEEQWAIDKMLGILDWDGT